MKNRTYLAAGAMLAAAALALTGCAGAGTGAAGGDATDSGSKGVIKIAAVLTEAGALAENAETVLNTWELAVDQINDAGGAGGYTFEVERYDTDATPATSIRSATQAVTQGGAKILAFQTSPENAAINPQLAGLNALSMNTMAQDDGLRGATCTANAFTIAQSNSMLFETLSADIDSLPGEKWAIIAVDYSTGHGAATSFTAAVEAAGKEVVSTQFAPLNTADYGSYITEIQNSGADAILQVMYGADASAFVTQADQYDLNASIDTHLTMNVITDAMLETQGAQVVDSYLVKQYDAAADHPGNQEFVEAYTELYGIGPNDYAGNTYLGAQALFAAVEKAKSDDVAAIRDALTGLSYDSIAGEVTIRSEDHQALTPSFIAQVVEDGDGFGYEILSTVDGDTSSPKANPECKL